MCVEDVSKVLIGSSLPHFKVCILVYINLTTLFRVLLETTFFAYESEKGTPVFLPGKNILKNSDSACENYKGRKGSFFQCIPSRDVLHREFYKSSLKRQVAKRLSPWLMGVTLLALVFPAGMYTCWLVPQGLFLILTLAYIAALLLARDCA